MSKKLYLITYGCQMNEYDSTKMASVLEASHGYTRTQDPDEADLLLLNTCSVREKAQEKVFSELGRWKDWKAAQPGRVIGVGGCVASQEGEAIARRAPMVDLVFGPQTLHRLPELLDTTRRTRKPAVDISFPEIEKFDRLPEPRAEGVTAFVSIMGNSGEWCDLALLITYLARFDGLKRIRYTTSHPAEFTDALIDSFADEPKLASYLHLPVQSGADRILGMMKRGYTRAEYLAKIKRIRAARPDISLSSDFIIGFPSESDDDFVQTMDLIAEAGFDGAFSFVYSPRPGTPAANLRDNVPPEVKKQRLSILQDRIRGLDTQFKHALVGSRQTVLVEKIAKKGGGQIAGRTSTNRWINFEAPEALIGHFTEVDVTEVQPNSLRGRWVPPAP